MKYIQFVFLFGLILCSCSERFQFDKTNALSVADALYKAGVDQDSLLLNKLFPYNGDSLSDYQRKSVAGVFDFLEGKNTSKLMIDTIASKPFVGIDHTLFHMSIYFRMDTNFYSLRARYERDTASNNVGLYSLQIVDLQEECEFDKEAPYAPSSDIDFINLSWETSNYGKSFSSGEIKLKNNSSYDIDYIKFRIIMKSRSSREDVPFLQQTIERHQKIYRGDIADIEVLGMRNYYVGFPIKSSEIIFDAELIEVLPKPESYWCKKRAQLKLLSN